MNQIEERQPPLTHDERKKVLQEMLSSDWEDWIEYERAWGEASRAHLTFSKPWDAPPTSDKTREREIAEIEQKTREKSVASKVRSPSMTTTQVVGMDETQCFGNEKNTDEFEPNGESVHEMIEGQMRPLRNSMSMLSRDMRQLVAGVENASQTRKKVTRNLIWMQGASLALLLGLLMFVMLLAINSPDSTSANSVNETGNNSVGQGKNSVSNATKKSIPAIARTAKESSNLCKILVPANSPFRIETAGNWEGCGFTLRWRVRKDGHFSLSEYNTSWKVYGEYESVEELPKYIEGMSIDRDFVLEVGILKGIRFVVPHPGWEQLDHLDNRRDIFRFVATNGFENTWVFFNNLTPMARIGAAIRFEIEDDGKEAGTDHLGVNSSRPSSNRLLHLNTVRLPANRTATIQIAEKPEFFRLLIFSRSLGASGSDGWRTLGTIKQDNASIEINPRNEERELAVIPILELTEASSRQFEFTSFLSNSLLMNPRFDESKAHDFFISGEGPYTPGWIITLSDQLGDTKTHIYVRVDIQDENELPATGRGQL